MSTEQILVVGEALTDCVSRGAGSDVVEVPGGSPLNVAIGLGRLGHEVVLATRFGDDARGAVMSEHVQASDVRLIPEAKGLARTSTAIAHLSGDGSARYEFDLVWDLRADMVTEGDYRHVHTGSIGATLEPGATGVREILARERAHGASVSYDPNARPQIMGSPQSVRTQVESIIDLSDVVKASDEDIDWLYPGSDLRDVATRWRQQGVALVVITRGADGVIAFGPEGSVELPTRASSVVDTIGAGDSFMSGLISGLSTRGLLGADSAERRASLGSDEIREILDFALRCAAVTVSRAGANPPTLAEVV